MPLYEDAVFQSAPISQSVVCHEANSAIIYGAFPLPQTQSGGKFVIFT